MMYCKYVVHTSNEEEIRPLLFAVWHVKTIRGRLVGCIMHALALCITNTLFDTFFNLCITNASISYTHSIWYYAMYN